MKTPQIVIALVEIRRHLKKRDTWAAEHELEALIEKLCYSTPTTKKSAVFRHKDSCPSEVDPEGYAPCTCRDAKIAVEDDT